MTQASLSTSGLTFSMCVSGIVFTGFRIKYGMTVAGSGMTVGVAQALIYMDSRLGFGFLRRSTAYFPVGVRGIDGERGGRGIKEIDQIGGFGVAARHRSPN